MTTIMMKINGGRAPIVPVTIVGKVKCAVGLHEWFTTAVKLCGSGSDFIEQCGRCRKKTW